MKKQASSPFEGLRVLLLDGYAKQNEAIMKELDRYGCEITTLNDSKLDVGYTSRYPKHKILDRYFKHDAAHLEKLIDKLVKSGKYDVVFPVLEPSVDVLTKKEEEYRSYVAIVAASREAFLLAYDKQNTMRICMEQGIPCPLTRLDDEDVSEFLDKVSYPIAIKPRKGAGSIGFKRVGSKAEMMKLIESGMVDPDQYIIQECVMNFKKKYICNLILDENSELCSALCAETTRWYPVDSGPASMLVTVDRPDLIDYSYRLLAEMHWKGLANVCYMLDPKDDQPKLLEINGRTPSFIAVDMHAGIPAIGQMLAIALGKPTPKGIINKHFGIGVRCFQTDTLWFLQSENRFKTNPSWLKHLALKDSIFNIADPLPFFSFSLEHFLSYKKDMEKRKRN